MEVGVEVREASHLSEGWRCTSLMPALGRLRQEELSSSEASLGYTMRLCVERGKKRKQRTELGVFACA